MAQGKLNLTCLMTDLATNEQSVVNLKVLSSASPPDRPTPGPTPPEPPLGIWGPTDPRPTLPIAGWNPDGSWGPPGGGGGGGETPPPGLKPPSGETPGVALVRNAPADAAPPADTSTWTHSQVAYGPGKIAEALIGPYIEHHPA